MRKTHHTFFKSLLLGSEAQTFGQCEDFRVHVSTEVFVVDQVFIIMGPQEGVVTHHLVVDGQDGTLRAVGGPLCTGYPQGVRVLLVTHGGHVLPDFTQGTTVVFYPQELQRKVLENHNRVKFRHLSANRSC